MTNYEECNQYLLIADDTTRSIEGYGDASFCFRSGNGHVDMLLTNVARVPDLCYDIFSLPTLIKNGHVFEGCPTGVIDRLKPERLNVFLVSGTLLSRYGYRVDSSARSRETLLYSSRDNSPIHLRLTSTTYTAPLDILTRLYSTRLRSTKALFSRGGGRGVSGVPWHTVLQKILSSPHTHEKIRNSGGLLWV